MRKTILSSLIGSVVLAAVAVLGAQISGSSADAGPKAPKAAVPGKTVSHQTAQSLSAVEGYWTAERMAAAQPYPVKEADESSEPQASSAPGESGAPGAVAGARPGGKLNTLDGATAGGDSAGSLDYPYHAIEAQHVSRHSVFGRFIRFPQSTVHKMFFSQDHDGNGTYSNFVCSSSTIGQDGVWTAGHCVHNGLGGAGAGGGWSTNVSFCPSYDNGVNPARGCWGAEELWTWSDWYFNGDLDADFGGADASDTGTVHATLIGNITGWLGLKWNWPRAQAWTAEGYPQGAPFNGQKLIVANGAFAYADSAGASVDSNVMPSDLTGGSSGGPWIEDYGFPGQQGGGGGNYLNGHNDWRHTSEPNEMASPHFDTRACHMYNAINDTSITC